MICYFEIISSTRKIGCSLDYDYVDDPTYGIYSLIPNVNIAANTEFLLVIK